MLNINKSILNNLIKNYINNKQKYIISANLRDISIDVKKIDQLIEKKSNHEYQINEINQQRNQLSKNANKEDINKAKILKQKENEIRNQIIIIYQDLYYSLLCLPCLLPDNINHTEDYKVYENSIHFDNNNKKNFTEYTSKNCYITHIRNITYDSKMIEYKKLILDICQKSCIDYNFSEIRPSTIVSTEDLLHSGHLPSFEDNLYKIDDNNYLIPTSEVSIFGYIINDILTKQEISEYKIFALTDCYRKENSATSKFNKPLIRQSCFEKNETFILCHKDNEINSFNLMIENVKNTLNKLNLKYRIINVCPKEMSKNAFIQYDFEVFFPSVQDYIEVSSVSLCINHQIMRSPIYKIAQHYSTLNASCLPINRIIAALIDYNK